MNNFIKIKSVDVLVSYGKVITPKNRVSQIIGLDKTYVGKINFIGDDSIGMTINIENSSTKSITLIDNLATSINSLRYLLLKKSLLGQPLNPCEMLNGNNTEAKVLIIISKKLVDKIIQIRILVIDLPINITLLVDCIKPRAKTPLMKEFMQSFEFKNTVIAQQKIRRTSYLVKLLKEPLFKSSKLIKCNERLNSFTFPHIKELNGPLSDLSIIEEQTFSMENLYEMENELFYDRNLDVIIRNLVNDIIKF